ncbi:uracil phosphoribosyltransferase [soil metagenome]
MVHILGAQNSIFNQYISEIRDVTVQHDSMRFRRNMERMGEIMAYEISKTLDYEVREFTTPLGIAPVSVPKQQPVIATILRAGLPLHHGILNYFDKGENGFISAYRRHHKDGTFDIHVEYLSTPELTDKVLILCDPMLATGSSMVLAYQALLKRGTPRHTHIAAVIASSEGIEYVKRHLPQNVTLWVGAVDEELTAQSYIVPGLGDAGDLAYGVKI